MSWASLAGGLPRRDLVLLPLVSLLTVVLMIGVGEVGCRILFPAMEGDACRMSDLALGYRNRPNCSDRQEAFEGSLVVESYNDCGYRSAQSCKPEPAGSSRIALIGSSIGAGHFVSYADSLGAQIGERLTEACRHPVDVQNLAAPRYYLKQIRLRATEALKLKPDVLLWVVSPFDLQMGDSDPPTIMHGFGQNQSAPSLLMRLHALALNSRAFAVMQHVYYEKASNYVPLFLLNGDKAGFLYRNYSPSWQQRVAFFEKISGEIVNEAKAAGVPVVVAFVPQRAQAAMTGMKEPSTIDPYSLNHTIQRIVDKQGGYFVDSTPVLARTGHAGSLFLPLDGHLDPQGHRLVGPAIADDLVNAQLPILSQCKGVLSTADAVGTGRLTR